MRAGDVYIRSYPITGAGFIMSLATCNYILVSLVMKAVSVKLVRFVQSKSNSTRQLLEFILQLQLFEQVKCYFDNFLVDAFF